MTSIKICSSSVANTMKFGESLAKHLEKGDIIALAGDLGSGKTTLVKGIYAGLGGKPGEEVRSPTFTIINEYHASLPVYHFDFYRLNDGLELGELGIEEYLFAEGISLIEWADRFPEFLGDDFLWIDMNWSGENERQLVITSKNPRFTAILNELKACYE